MKTWLFVCFLCFCIQDTCFAQLCNGNLGDPIINITFGNSPAPLPAGTTMLRYVQGCPYDTGAYTIGNFIVGCGENAGAHSWHQLTGDHTKDSNGQFMLVNASWALGLSHAPTIIHLDTATALCGNTGYQYSAWLANVMRDYACSNQPLLPNITFTVSSLSGTVLATANSGALPIEDSRIWKQYGLTFTTPPDVDAVVLTLSIEAKQGCGNAFVVDDIALNMCGPALKATLDGAAEPAIVCAGYTNPFVLKGGYAAGFTDPVVQWQNSMDKGTTWNDIPEGTTATYRIPRRSDGVVLYRMAVAERPNIHSPHCRIISNAIYTEVYPAPVHHALQSLIGCINKTLPLPAADPYAEAVTWTGPNNFSATALKAVIPNIQYADTGLYRFTQRFYAGCTSTDSFYLNVYPSTTISVQDRYSVCEGTVIHLSASGAGSFKWTPATGLSGDAIANPTLVPHDSTRYKVVVTNTFGCKDSAEVAVNVLRNPDVNAGADKTIVVGDTVSLHAAVRGTAVRYSWSPQTFIDDPASLTPNVFPPENTAYTITATSTVGCGTVTSTAFVQVYKDIFIPTAFTPNGDGINDVFKVVAADGYAILKFQIYNRWGNLVFSARGGSDSWDGTTRNILQPSGSYVYLFEIKSASGKKIIKKGTITLLR